MKCHKDFQTDVFLDMEHVRPQLHTLLSALNITIDEMCYHYRGQFMASAGALHAFRQKWSRLMSDVLIPQLESSNDPPMGHVLERMWVMLFRVAAASASA